jgi:hypothetical protein
VLAIHDVEDLLIGFITTCNKYVHLICQFSSFGKLIVFGVEDELCKEN